MAPGFCQYVTTNRLHHQHHQLSDRGTSIELALEAIENSEIHEIHQIQEALKRISEGTYGICAHCGEEIDPKRLQALPTATRCISCAA